MLTITIKNKISKWGFIPFFLIGIIVFSIFTFIVIKIIIVIVTFFVSNEKINLVGILNYPIYSYILSGLLIEIIYQPIASEIDGKTENKASLEDWKKPKNTFTKKSTTSCLPVWIKNIWHIFNTIFYFFSWKHYNDALIGWNSVCEKPDCDSQISHDAIVLNIYSFIRPDPVFTGVNVLINHLNIHKIPYKVYCCENSKDFLDVVNDPNNKILWIFGHGSRELLRCFDKKCEYEKLVQALKPEALNKDYVYQFTCNNSDEKSLADYLSNGKGFANYKINDTYEIKKWIEIVVNDDSWKIH